MSSLLGLVASPTDARLFQHLAEPLKDAGHALTLAGPPEFLPDLDVPCVSLTTDAPEPSSRGLLGEHEPDLLITPRDDTPWASTMVRAAQASGTPQLLVQSDIWLSRRRTRVRLRTHPRTGREVLASARRLARPEPTLGLAGCTAIAAASERFVEHLQSSGVEAARIHRTGSPLYRPLECADYAERSPLVPTAVSYTIYAHRPGLPLEVELRELKRLHRFCHLSGTRLMVLFEIPSPSRLDALRAGLPSDTLFADAGEDRLTLIAGARALVTSSSNLALDALALRRPIGIMRYLPLREELSLGKAAIGIDHRRDLEMRIIGLLTDPGLRDLMLVLYPDVLEAETYNADGAAAERLIELIGRMVAGRAAA